jgi:hypothetical protein
MDIQDIVELSPLQQGLLFHALRDPKSPVYFEQVNCTLRGALDVEGFQRAWEYVVSRHDALRTALQWEDLEKPYQIVYRAVPMPFQFLDWSQLSGDEPVAVQLPPRVARWVVVDDRAQRGISLVRCVRRRQESRSGASPFISRVHQVAAGAGRRRRRTILAGNFEGLCGAEYAARRP